MIGDAVVINKGASASIFAYGIPQSGNQAYATKGSKTVQGRWYTKRNPLSHDLPSGYTELTYIQSSGTQYIDTGVYCSNSDKITIDFIITSSPEYESHIFGGRTSAQLNNLTLTYNETYEESSQHAYGLDYGDYNINRKYIVSDKNTRIVAEISNTQFKINSNSVQLSQATFTMDFPAYLFYNSGNTYRQEKMIGKVYSCKIDGKRNFIPCINPNNEVGMYDLVSQTFFGNSGTGSFIAGDVVPQYTYGFLISPINELGTWTVHAIRDGVDRTTTVLVDAAEMYEVNTFSRLPSGYTEVEYIQSSGTQYINSGIAQNSNTEIECKYSVYSGTNSIGTIIGNANSGTGSNRFLLLCAYPNAGRTDFAIGDSLYTSVSHTVTLNTPIHVIAKNGYVEVDGLKEYPTSTPFSTVISNMYLFAQHWNDIAELLSKIRIHYLTISNSGTLQRNFIPCHNSSNVIGMYDLVSNTFFTNAGTGVFVAGPEVVA